MVAHDLVFFVGQRQGRGHGDRIACVYTHRIDVLDRANDDRIVSGVTHHLHFELFPAKQAFVDQDLPHWRRVHARAAVEFVIVAVIGHATAGAAHGKGRADNCGQADIVQRVERKLNPRRKVFLAAGRNRRCDDGCLGVFDAQPVHRFAEKFAILCHFNGFAFRANHLDVEFLQHAHLFERERCVQPGLAAHCRQQRVGAFFFDDLGDNFRGDGFDVGGICQPGIGHDRRRVGVHEDDPVAFFFQGLAGLRAGVVELARLTDDNGPRSNDHDRLDIGSFWHGSGPRMFANSPRYRPWGQRCKGAYRDRGRVFRQHPRSRHAALCRAVPVSLNQGSEMPAKRPRSRAAFPHVASGLRPAVWQSGPAGTAP